MTNRSSKDAERLYCLVPEDGTAIGNKTLLEKLNWSEQRYRDVRQKLLNDGWIRLGYGRGGSVRRVQGDAQQLLAKVPLDGAPIGNATLRRELGWKDDHYWMIRNELIDQGVLSRGGGRGGSVFRLIEIEEPDDEDKIDIKHLPAVGDKRRREIDLYEPIKDVLENDWAMDKQLPKGTFFAEITAYNRSTSGRWSRPDLAIVSHRLFEHTGQRVFDVYTFEVKPTGAWDITAIYEALAHRRCATYSYALFERTHHDARRKSILDDCAKEARRHGIGLIVADDPSSYEAWETRVEPRRHNADPEAMERFVIGQIPHERHAMLRKWSK